MATIAIEITVPDDEDPMVNELRHEVAIGYVISSLDNLYPRLLRTLTGITIKATYPDERVENWPWPAEER